MPAAQVCFVHVSDPFLRVKAMASPSLFDETGLPAAQGIDARMFRLEVLLLDIHSIVMAGCFPQAHLFCPPISTPAPDPCEPGQRASFEAIVKDDRQPLSTSKRRRARATATRTRLWQAAANKLKAGRVEDSNSETESQKQCLKDDDALLEASSPAARFSEELGEVEDDSFMQAISPSVRQLVEKQLDALHASIKQWPPVRDVAEEAGCAIIIDMLHDAAREVVSSAVGPLTAERDSLLKGIVCIYAKQGLETWRASSMDSS